MMRRLFFHVFVLTPVLSATTSDAVEATHLLKQSGIQGGLVVHVGCGNEALIAAWGGEDTFTVQGLAANPGQLAKARKAIRATGRYGRVSARLWSGGALPYVDNLVNLLIVDDANTKLPKGEVARVLAPRGIALLAEGVPAEGLQEQPGGGRLIKYTKPVPAGIDDWPHYLYGPDNNAVSKDTRVGPPQRMQWVVGPAYARSHEVNSSMAGMVSAGGRVFYIWDEGPSGQPEKRFPAQWKLIARDGFNGMLLWKRPMPNWGWRQWHVPSRWDLLRALPRTTPRRLVATRGKLYVTLGYEAPVSVLDAATGKVLSVLEDTKGTDEILLDGGTLFLVIRDTARPKQLKRDFRISQNTGRIAAFDAETGKKKWQTKARVMAQLSLASRKQRLYFAQRDQVLCLDATNGRDLWASEPIKTGGSIGTLVATDEAIAVACGPVKGQKVEQRGYQRIRYHQAHALSAKTGKHLWAGPMYRGPSGHGRDIFYIDGLFWFGVHTKDNLPCHFNDTTTRRVGYDPRTGKVVRTVSVAKLTSPGHHYRCYRSKATERFLLLPKRGVEFLDLKGKDHMRHDWLRAPCIYGFLPANGMLYTAPHQCVCYQGVLLSNFTALFAAAGATAPKPAETLKPGPAFGTVPTEALSTPAGADWPMYRHDTRRSGSADTSVAARPRTRWSVDLAAPITPPVVVRGKLLVAEKDEHTVRTLDAANGKTLWSFTANARIDSPPTVYGSLVFFGSTGGWVYCLKLEDGQEVWRFQAAPADRQVGAFGQLESTWPVHGTVVVQNDITAKPPRPLVYFTAGRSTYLDGGIFVYALDPVTGEVVHRNRLDGPRPDPFKDQGGAGYIDGAKSDILVSDGADLFLHQERFRSDLKRFPAPMEGMQRESGGYRRYKPAPQRGSNAMRLLSSRGFLDDSYNEGTYWAYSQRWPGWDRHMNRIGAWGQLLVVDARHVFGVNVFTERNRVRRGFSPGTKGYRVFAKPYQPGQDEMAFKKTEDKWSVRIPVRVRAMVLAEDKLFVAGPPDVIPEDDPAAAFEGRMGGDLWALSATDGMTLAKLKRLAAPPVYDGLIAANGALYLSTADGKVHCFGAKQ